MTGVLDRLGAHGHHYHDPIASVDWSSADDAAPWLPYQLLSTANLTDFAKSSDDQLWRFSQVEFARLCAAGMWLEGLLISRVTAKGFLGLRADEARVMLQEVREESGHSLMFLEMIDRARLTNVPLLGETRLLSWVARRLDPAGPEFWAMVFVGETVTDTFALKALKLHRDGEAELCPVARQVLDLHHRDEARHISAARIFLANRMEQMTPPRRAVFSRLLRFLLNRFLDATLYPTPESLAAAGFENATVLARRIRRCPNREKLARECAAPALDLLSRDGLAANARPNLEEARP